MNITITEENVTVTIAEEDVAVTIADGAVTVTVTDGLLSTSDVAAAISAHAALIAGVHGLTANISAALSGAAAPSAANVFATMADVGASGLTATYIGFGSGTNLLTGSANFIWSGNVQSIRGDIHFFNDAVPTLRKILVNAQTAADTAGNALTISAGNGKGTGIGAQLSLVGGDGVDNAASYGGTVRLKGGEGFYSNGAYINVTGGDSDGVGWGASIYMYGGNAGFGDTLGGECTFAGGTGSGTGSGGEVNFNSGQGGDTSGPGGNVILTAGGGGAPNGNGGQVRLRAGTKQGGGADGTVRIIKPGDTIGAIFDVSLVAASDKTFIFPNTSGTFALGTGTTNRIGYWSGTNTLTGSSNLTWNNTNATLTVTHSGDTSPALHIGFDSDVQYYHFYKHGWAAVGVDTDPLPYFAIESLHSGALDYVCKFQLYPGGGYAAEHLYALQSTAPNFWIKAHGNLYFRPGEDGTFSKVSGKEMRILSENGLTVANWENNVTYGSITSGGTNSTQFTSTVAIGTSPYACTSTTLNSNLNADYVDGLHSSSLAKLATANTFTVGQQIIQTGADANIGLIVQGYSATQSANLQEWRDQWDDVIAFIKHSGPYSCELQLGVTAANTITMNTASMCSLYFKRYVITQDQTVYFLTGSDQYASMGFNANSSTFAWNSTRTDVDIKFQVGGVTTYTLSPNAMSTICNLFTPTNAAQIVATVRGYVSQSADLQQWQDSTTAVLGRFNAAGNLLLGTATDGMTANGSLAIAKDLAHRGAKAGFYNTAPIVLQTGVVVSAAGIHAALVALGLITA